MTTLTALAVAPQNPSEQAAAAAAQIRGAAEAARQDAANAIRQAEQSRQDAMRQAEQAGQAARQGKTAAGSYGSSSVLQPVNRVARKLA